MRLNWKETVVFLGTDVNDSVKISRDHGIVFRTSGFLSQAGSNVYGCPTVNYDAGTPKDYKTKLSISFTGYKYTSDIGRAGHKFNKIREHIVDDLLLKIPNKCDFILRDVGLSWDQTKNRFSSKYTQKSVWFVCSWGRQFFIPSWRNFNDG